MGYKYYISECNDMSDEHEVTEDEALKRFNDEIKESGINEVVFMDYDGIDDGVKPFHGRANRFAEQSNLDD